MLLNGSSFTVPNANGLRCNGVFHQTHLSVMNITTGAVSSIFHTHFLASETQKWKNQINKNLENRKIQKSGKTI